MRTWAGKTERRICWPDPDRVCLEGGCGYCNQHVFRDLDEIQRWAENAPDPRLWQAWVFGLQNDFWNAETR